MREERLNLETDLIINGLFNVYYINENQRMAAKMFHSL